MGEDSEGSQIRQQAAKLCDLASKYHLTQQVGIPTREREVLDLIWSSNPDLVSSVMVDSFSEFTDHGVVTATTTYRLGKELVKDEQFLLESGQRFRKLDFSKAPWPRLQTRLKQLDWGPLQALAKEDVIAAHALFINTILPIMEE